MPAPLESPQLAVDTAEVPQSVGQRTVMSSATGDYSRTDPVPSTTMIWAGGPPRLLHPGSLGSTSSAVTVSLKVPVMPRSAQAPAAALRDITEREREVLRPGESRPGGYPGRGGGPWLCRILLLSLFHALVVPSPLTTRVQPMRWMQT
jgi:hypothetical protein